MKSNNLQSILYTDVRTLLYRIRFAVSPARVVWPLDLDSQTDPPIVPSDPAQVWADGIIWSNSIFWTNSPTWGHGAGLESSSAQACRQSEPRE